MIIPSPYKNYPNSYAEFEELFKGGHKATQMGFHANNEKVLRFNNRFRLARAFLGIKLDRYNQETIAGYDSLFKTFLAYSAFELFLELIGQKQDTLAGLLAPHNPEKHIKMVVTKDKGRNFYAFLHKHLDRPNAKRNLSAVYSGNSHNITYIASSIRHIFAHGHLSAHANKCAPATVSDICDIIFTFHMKVMDDEFSRIVIAYKATI